MQFRLRTPITTALLRALTCKACAPAIARARAHKSYILHTHLHSLHAHSCTCTLMPCAHTRCTLTCARAHVSQMYAGRVHSFAELARPLLHARVHKIHLACTHTCTARVRVIASTLTLCAHTRCTLARARTPFAPTFLLARARQSRLHVLTHLSENEFSYSTGTSDQP